MSTQKHTPGPWKVIGTSIFRGDKSAAHLSNDELSRVAEIVTREKPGALSLDPRDDDGEAQANARLVAAAPELLAALEWAVGAMLPHADCDEALQNAHKAIAKSQGRLA